MVLEKFIDIIPNILACIWSLVERILIEDVDKFFLKRWSKFMLSNKAYKLDKIIDKMCNDGYFIKEQKLEDIYLIRN